MHVSQCKYARELLEKANMTNANPVPTPMVSSPTLTSLIGVALEDARLYRQTVGDCNTYVFTFAVNKVSRYMHQPHDSHWSAVKRILRYVKGVP